MRICIITGSGSGLGKALMEHLAFQTRNVDHAYPFDSVLGVDINGGSNIEDYPMHNKDLQLDVTHPAQWDFLAEVILKEGDNVSCIINCCGVNSIDYLENFREEEWDRLIDTNAKSIFLSSKAFLEHLSDTSGVIVNITSNASHMPMTSSLAYNASKAAAHIMTQQLARELTKRHGITVFGVAPNKMSGTAMSGYIEGAVPRVRGWTPEQAKAYQEASLLAGETPPELVAEFISFLLSSPARHKHLTGCIMPYGI